MTNNERKEYISALRQLLAMCDFVDQYGDFIDADPYFNAVEIAIDSLNKTAWIPVSERLPEDSNSVLVTRDGDIEFGKYEDNEWFFWLDSCWVNTDFVIAWMPMPPVYQGE